MSFSVADRRLMARALVLAARGLTTTHPNPRVGCVIARDDVVVGEGWHQRAGGPHAEVHALGAAGGSARGATAYVTLEPCCHTGRTPPCTDALLAAGIRRVVYGARDPNPRVNGGGAAALRAAGVTVEGGLLAAGSDALNEGFNLRLTRGRPLTRLKIAATLDGRTALADGRSQWLTGTAARRDVQRWRAQSAAVMTGSGTILADDPRLDVRDSGEPEPRQPLRVILDSRLRTPPIARVLVPPGEALILTTDVSAAAAPLVARGVRVETVATVGGQLDLAAVLGRLAALEINEVWVEAGPRLSGALLAAGLVDELVVYQAPTVLGDAARGMFAFPSPAAPGDGPRFRLLSARSVGDDLRLVYRPAPAD